MHCIIPAGFAVIMGNIHRKATGNFSAEKLHLLDLFRILETDTDTEQPNSTIVASSPCFGEQLAEDRGIDEVAGALGGGAVEVGEFQFHDERADDAVGMGFGEIFL